MMEFFSPEAMIALFTLTSLEIVLGIDNVIFIAILAGKLPESQRDYARKFGLTLAVLSRAVLVLAIGFVMQLNQPLFTVFGTGFSGKDLILVLGGLFLLGKATYEIHRKIEHASDPEMKTSGVTTLKAVLTQVLIVDVVFSLDSVITAVGMTEGLKNPIPIMIAAIMISVAVMLVYSKAIVSFIESHPALKILALSFLLLIGTLLVAEGPPDDVRAHAHSHTGQALREYDVAMGAGAVSATGVSTGSGAATGSGATASATGASACWGRTRSKRHRRGMKRRGKRRRSGSRRRRKSSRRARFV
jgi:predicted tellurium resistance membrane protein TerC